MTVLLIYLGAKHVHTKNRMWLGMDRFHFFKNNRLAVLKSKRSFLESKANEMVYKLDPTQFYG